MIEHTVTFLLKHEPGSPAEQTFLEAAAKLSAIPGVKAFSIRRQTSPKNKHTFGISMQFDTHAEFLLYTDHPEHTAFVETYWLNEVVDFQEADFEPLTDE